jgi:hypothetical protein
MQTSQPMRHSRKTKLNMPDQNEKTVAYACHVFRGEDFKVTSGANLGDPLLAIDEVCAGDTYRLLEGSGAWKLALNFVEVPGAALTLGQGQGAQVADGSEVGHPEAPVFVAGKLSFMGSDGYTVDVLLIEVTSTGDQDSELCALPLSPIAPKVDYTLIGLTEDPGDVQITDVTSIAFMRSTLITLASGMQVPIEDLKVGDRLLTRDSGAQPLRWIGRRTVRAIGPYAPVVIPKDTMGNTNDLFVSQHQRLFIYQRGIDRLTATAEMLVKAQFLVDDETIVVREGGFVDYYSLVFDQHEVIYAECIPCDSFEVNAATRAHLPEDHAEEVQSILPDISHETHFGTEASAEMLRSGRHKIVRGAKPNPEDS